MFIWEETLYSFSLAAVTNYHKFNPKITVAKTNTNFLSDSSGGQKSLMDSHWAQAEGLVGLCSLAEALGENPSPASEATVVLGLWSHSVLKASNGQLGLSFLTSLGLCCCRHISFDSLPPCPL